MTKFKYPDLVTKLTTICNAWIIGSAVTENNPKDYDIFIPFKYWKECCAIIPKDSKINTLGGFKCINDNKEIDIWTGDFETLISSSYFKNAYHPQSGITITKN